MFADICVNSVSVTINKLHPACTAYNYSNHNTSRILKTPFYDAWCNFLISSCSCAVALYGFNLQNIKHSMENTPAGDFTFQKAQITLSYKPLSFDFLSSVFARNNDAYICREDCHLIKLSTVWPEDHSNLFSILSVNSEFSTYDIIRHPAMHM